MILLVPLGPSSSLNSQQTLFFESEKDLNANVWTKLPDGRGSFIGGSDARIITRPLLYACAGRSVGRLSRPTISTTSSSLGQPRGAYIGTGSRKKSDTSPGRPERWPLYQHRFLAAERDSAAWKAANPVRCSASSRRAPALRRSPSWMWAPLIPDTEVSHGSG
jgi:hypothetical protein